MSAVDQAPDVRSRNGAIEIGPGLHALGDAIAMDGRISWLPDSAKGYQATRAYLIADGDSFLVVDPGLRTQEDLVIAQIGDFVAKGTPIAAFLTRSEPDCFGGLEKINATFPLAKILTGGGHNPFDGFEDIGGMQLGKRGDVVAVAREGRIAPIPFGKNRTLEVLHAPLRINSTFWAYDSGSHTLFTSDAFSHSVGDTRASALEIDHGLDFDVATVREHLITKFWWMETANTRPALKALKEIFDTHRIDNICPSHGRPFVGRDPVRKAYGVLKAALELSLPIHASMEAGR